MGNNWFMEELLERWDEILATPFKMDRESGLKEYDSRLPADEDMRRLCSHMRETAEEPFLILDRKRGVAYKNTGALTFGEVLDIETNTFTYRAGLGYLMNSEFMDN